MRARAAVAFVATIGATTALTLTGVSSAGAQALPDNCYDFGESTTCTFGFTGAPQAFMVPNGVFSVHIRAIGAIGGSSHTHRGGYGAVVDDDFVVLPGMVLYAVVGGHGATPGPGTKGGGGFNGGGDGTGGALDAEDVGAAGGGGASDVRLDPNNVGTRIIVAAGGGGASYGAQGGDAGLPGQSADPVVAGGGQPGGLFAGGAGGSGDHEGLPGTFGAGGAGGVREARGAGGGGGGFFGGGGGGVSNLSPFTGSGGGGSSMSLGGAVSEVLYEDAYVTISYEYPKEPCVGSVCFGS